jgi:hypothetical protein
MRTKIKELIETQKLCSVYTNAKSTDKFSVGFLLKYDDKYFIMESIDQYGKSDGIFCSLIDNIFKVEDENEYISCIQKLFSYFKQTRYKNPMLKDGILKSFIDYIVENKKICSIELCNSGICDAVGFISKITNGIIELVVIDQYGRRDGVQTITLADISHISCDSTDDIKTETLFKINSK